MALAAGSAVWLVVPPLARRVIAGDPGPWVVPVDFRSGLWQPFASSSPPLTDAEILTLWVAAAGAALLAGLATLRLVSARR
jgi:hypothetical protein